jgi:hypothetical protein
MTVPRAIPAPYLSRLILFLELISIAVPSGMRITVPEIAHYLRQGILLVKG